MSYFYLNHINNKEVEHTLQEIPGLTLYEEYLTKGRTIYLADDVDWFLIEDSNRNILGYLCCSYDRFLPTSCNISIFEITEEYRGQGLGRSVLNHFKRSAKGLFSSLSLQIRKPELIPFYTSLGFQKDENQSPFYFLYL